MLVACKPDPVVETPPPYLGAVNLPSDPFNYAAPALPAYFNRDSIRLMDNTPADNPTTDWGATLGRVLFYDTTLSANYTVSCASCHEQSAGFSDPRRFSQGLEGEQTTRNSMGLANARYYRNKAFFWDERAATLEEQVLLPIQDHIEMGLSLPELMSRLANHAFYPYLYEKAFGDSTIDADRTARALAQFIRSMVAYQSRYDEGREEVSAFTDDFPNFTAEENLGKNIFYNPGIGNCAACHAPDVFSSKDIFNIGLEMNYPDPGVGGETGNPSQQGFFKAPSLRNIALTAPYMHDGRFATLEEVIDFYNDEVAAHPNLSPEMRMWPDGPPRGLFLSEAEKAALKAFLETLTDEGLVDDDKFSNPFL